MPSKRKTRKINKSVASAKKNVSNAASKLNVRKDMASVVKNNKTKPLGKTLDMRYGMKQNQKGWNPYAYGSAEIYMNQKSGSFDKHGRDIDKTSKLIDTKKRQTGISRDTPLPKTSDKYFK